MHPLTCFDVHAGAPKATHCMACKEEGMINVVSRKCHCGRAVPNFGAAGQKKRTHCAQCKEPGMVNLSKNPAARQPLPQIPVPPPMIMSPQDPMMGMHPHHQVSMGQQVLPHCLWTVLSTCACNYSCLAFWPLAISEHTSKRVSCMAHDVFQTIFITTLYLVRPSV